MEVPERLAVFDMCVLSSGTDEDLFHKVKIIKIIQAVGNFKKKKKKSPANGLT